MSSEQAARTEPLGQLLMRQGLITAEELRQALNEQQQTREPLGSILIRRGNVPAHVVLREIAGQHGELEYVDLDETTLDDDAVRLLPGHLALKLQALPIGWQGGRLRVAMAQPRDSFAVDAVRDETDSRVTPLLAEPRQLEAVTRRFWERVSRRAAPEPPAAAPPVERPRLHIARPPATDGHEQPPVVAFVDHVLARALGAGASDLHLDPTAGDLVVRFRVDGVLNESLTLPKTASRAVLDRVKYMSGLDLECQNLPQEGRLTFEHDGSQVQARVVTLPTAEGEAIAVRILDRGPRVLALTEIGLDPRSLAAWEQALARPTGAVLVTGPSRSGRSTTLFSSIQRLDARAKNVVTVEQSVEVTIPGVKQIVVDLSDGPSVVAFLDSILRADPDVMVVSEVRDPGAARAITRAATTGHLVLASLHADSAADAPAMLVDMGITASEVAGALTCVSSQRLLRRLCDACKVPDPAGQGRFRPAGCSRCGNTGFSGRFAVHEVMPVSDSIAKAIRDGHGHRVLHQIAVQEGMVSLVDAGSRHVAAGQTSSCELARVFGGLGGDSSGPGGG